MDKQSLAIRTRQWYEIVLEANSSSLSKKEWCRQNSISLKSFYYLQRKLRQKEAEKLRDVTPAALTCLNEAFPHSLAANTHVETEERTRSAGTGILPELIMQKGAYHLLIGKGISEDTLITVLRAIDHA
jgi:hypothetical protein